MPNQVHMREQALGFDEKISLFCSQKAVERLENSSGEWTEQVYLHLKYNAKFHRIYYKTTGTQFWHITFVVIILLKS